MKFPVWVIRILLFVLPFVLTLHNTAEVSFVLPLGAVQHSPLILIALAFLAIGILLVMLAVTPRVMRYRFAASRPRRQISHMKKAKTVIEVSTPMIAGSSYHVPDPKA